MLLLMRRVGEMIRINDHITLRVERIQRDSVTFHVKGLKEVDQNKFKFIDSKEEKLP